MSELSDILTARVHIRRLAASSTTVLGQKILAESTIYTNLPVRFYAIAGKIRMMAQGQQKVAQYKIMADWDKDIRENDLMYAVSGVSGLTLGRVSFVETLFDFDGITHHVEAEIIRP